MTLCKMMLSKQQALVFNAEKSKNIDRRGFDVTNRHGSIFFLNVAKQ